MKNEISLSELKNKFPVIEKEKLFSKLSEKYYTSELVSIFEKRLETQEEIEKKLNPIVGSVDKPNFNYELFYLQSNKFKRFYISLFNNHSLYTIDEYVEENEVPFKLVTTEKELLQFWNKRVHEFKLPTYCIPELNVMIVACFDFFECIFYNLHVTEEQQLKLKNYYLEAGFFLLND